MDTINFSALTLSSAYLESSTLSGSGAQLVTSSPTSANKLFNIYDLVHMIFVSSSLDLHDICRVMRINKTTYNVAQTSLRVISSKESWFPYNDSLQCWNACGYGITDQSKFHLYGELCGGLSAEQVAQGVHDLPSRLTAPSSPLQKVIDFRHYARTFVMPSIPKQTWIRGYELIIELRFVKTATVPALFLVTAGRTIINIGDGKSQPVWQGIMIAHPSVRVIVSIGDEFEYLPRGATLGDLYNWLCEIAGPEKSLGARGAQYVR